MYKKILLAADGSEHSIRATKNALMIGKCDPSSKIEILYVIAHVKVKSAVLSNWNSAEIGRKHKQRLKIVEDLVKQSSIPYETKILHGEPGPTIVNYANINHFDVIVIGSRGLNALQKFVLGSVSHKVAKRANCPVLIVK